METVTENYETVIANVGNVIEAPENVIEVLGNVIEELIQHIIEVLGNVIEELIQYIAQFSDRVRKIIGILCLIWKKHSTVPCEYHPRERKCREVRLDIDKRRFIKAMRQRR